MKKLNIIKKTALLLAFSVFMSVVSGCADVQEKPTDVKDIYTELKCDNEINYNGQGRFNVNISGTTAFSEDIGTEDVKICYVTADKENLPQIDSESGILLNDDEYKLSEITPLEVTVNSSSSVTVSFRDIYFTNNRPCGYIFIFDKDSSEEDKLLYCYAPVRYSSYSMVSDTAHIVKGNEKATIKLTLDKTSFSDKITENNITLSGGFSSCSIENVQRLGENTLTIDMLCKYNDNSQIGYITVDKSVITDSSDDVTAEIKIASPSVITDMSGFEATFNFSCVPINLKDATFNESVSADMITCDNPAISINRVSRNSADEAMIYFSFDFETVEDAISEISKSNFSISKKALNIGETLDFTVKPSEPDISAQILSVTESGSDFRVTAKFSVINGSFNVVSKTSFVFGGDFSKAVVDTIQLQDDNAEIEFTIPKTSDIDSVELYGTVALKSSSLFNRWGENESIPAFPLRYSAKERNADLSGKEFSENDMKHLITLISKCWENMFTEDYSKISNIGKVSYEDAKKLSFYLDLLEENVIYFDNLHLKINNSVHMSRTSDKKHSINDAINKLDVFLSDMDMLRAVVMSAQPHLDTIALYEEAKLDDMTPEEVDKLTDEYKKSVNAIRTLFNSKIKGKSFTELVIEITDSYMAENGALYSFDYLIERSHNWQPQTIAPKNEFRYYVNGILSKAYLISVYSLAMDSEITAENEQYILLSESSRRIAEFFISNEIEKTGGDKVFCNTLGRSFSLDMLKNHSSYEGITSAQISQLVNMLPEGVTLKEELLSVGFDIADVRYLVCSDSDAGSSHTSLSLSDEEGAKKLYNHTSRATVYDLIASELIDGFVYESYSTLLVSKDGELPDVRMLAIKNTELYSLQ